ncbi:MAG: NAD(P)-dependent oxidoreductase [Proteobacteria bacterium]|nr:NAD(P)-dependent oxidoreductase [Pseudomonadota bacterium]
MAIGFIGLGNIGAPMARRLLKPDRPLWVFDADATRTQALAAQGAHAARDLAELAGHSELVGVCVRDERDVESVLEGPGGLLSNLAPRAVIAIHSTVSQAAILRWARSATERGLMLIDAPITGGAGAAEAGTLTYMVGAQAEVLERCRPVFMGAAQKIIHAGPVGAGILLKLCNNLMSYAAFAALDEAHRLALAGGLDVGLLAEVGRTNGVVTPQMEAFLNNRSRLVAAGPAVLAQVFGPFALLARKDLDAALASARDLNVQLPCTEQLAAEIGGVFLNQDPPRTAP